MALSVCLLQAVFAVAVGVTPPLVIPVPVPAALPGASVATQMLGTNVGVAVAPISTVSAAGPLAPPAKNIESTAEQQSSESRFVTGHTVFLRAQAGHAKTSSTSALLALFGAFLLAAVSTRGAAGLWCSHRWRTCDTMKGMELGTVKESYAVEPRDQLAVAAFTSEARGPLCVGAPPRSAALALAVAPLTMPSRNAGERRVQGSGPLEQTMALSFIGCRSVFTAARKGSRGSSRDRVASTRQNAINLKEQTLPRLTVKTAPLEEIPEVTKIYSNPAVHNKAVGGFRWRLEREWADEQVADSMNRLEIERAELNEGSRGVSRDRVASTRQNAIKLKEQTLPRLTVKTAPLEEIPEVTKIYSNPAVHNEAEGGFRGRLEREWVKEQVADSMNRLEIEWAKLNEERRRFREEVRREEEEKQRRRREEEERKKRGRREDEERKQIRRREEEVEEERKKSGRREAMRLQSREKQSQATELGLVGDAAGSNAKAFLEWEESLVRHNHSGHSGIDVMGKKHRLHFRPLANAAELHEKYSSWEDVVRGEIPSGLSEQDRLRWRQELSELDDVDRAVFEYRRSRAHLTQPEKAQLEWETGKPAGSVSKERITSSIRFRKALAKYGWLIKLQKQLEGQVIRMTEAVEAIHVKQRSKLSRWSGPLLASRLSVVPEWMAAIDATMNTTGFKTANPDALAAAAYLAYDDALSIGTEADHEVAYRRAMGCGFEPFSKTIYKHVGKWALKLQQPQFLQPQLQELVQAEAEAAGAAKSGAPEAAASGSSSGSGSGSNFFDLEDDLDAQLRRELLQQRAAANVRPIHGGPGQASNLQRSLQVGGLLVQPAMAATRRLTGLQLVSERLLQKHEKLPEGERAALQQLCQQLFDAAVSSGARGPAAAAAKAKQEEDIFGRRLAERLASHDTAHGSSLAAELEEHMQAERAAFAEKLSVVVIQTASAALLQGETDIVGMSSSTDVPRQFTRCVPAVKLNMDVGRAAAMMLFVDMRKREASIGVLAHQLKRLVELENEQTEPSTASLLWKTYKRDTKKSIERLSAMSPIRRRILMKESRERAVEEAQHEREGQALVDPELEPYASSAQHSSVSLASAGDGSGIGSGAAVQAYYDVLLERPCFLWGSMELSLVGSFLMHHLLEAAQFIPPPPEKDGEGQQRNGEVEEDVAEKVARGQRKLQPAFERVSAFRRNSKSKNYYTAHPRLAEAVLLGNPETLRERVNPTKLPMLVPPLRWEQVSSGQYTGGFLHQRAPLVQTRFSQHFDRLRVTPASEMQQVLDGLNVMGACAWRINNVTFEVASKAWNEHLSVDWLPDQKDVPVPEHLPGGPETAVKAPMEVSETDGLKEQEAARRAEAEAAGLSDKSSMAELRAYVKEHNLDIRINGVGRTKHAILADILSGRYPPRAAETADEEAARRERYREIAVAKAENFNRRSQRAMAKLKLAVARRFANDVFYFPYSLDFRGRAYALSPHLNPQQDDLCRGILDFAKGKPLGPRGFYWLQVHLANMYGGMGKQPFSDRRAWTQKMIASGMVDRAASTAASLGKDDREAFDWWNAAEYPLQTLAACVEVAAAMRAPSLDEFVSHVPVQMDGTCNVMQHYAALLRDVRGGASVNLTPSDKPQDVYMGVCTLVNQKLQRDLDAPPAEGDSEDAKEAEQTRAMARRLSGLVERKVVKQTVMTSVYGVSHIGGRDQIWKKLKGLDPLKDASDKELNSLASYLTKKVFSSLDEISAGMMQTMAWLRKIASAKVKQSGKSISWTTPLGLPVVQPYVQSKTVNVQGFKSTFNFDVSEWEGSSEPSTRKQSSAFPPNFIHSLDSSHMLLTAKACRDAGLEFTSVHDSYWTHACDVDKLGVILREQFVRLHEQPLLLRLQEQFADSEASDLHNLKLPPKGELDLTLVKDSPYFFS